MQDNQLRRFGVLIWVFVALVLFSTMAKAQTATEQEEWSRENSACLGGANTPETWKHCERREELRKKLKGEDKAKAQTGMWDLLLVATGDIIPMNFPSLEACQQYLANNYDHARTEKCVPASGYGVWGRAAQIGWGVFEDGTGQPLDNNVWASQSECERYRHVRLNFQLPGAWSCKPATLYKK